MPSLNLEFKDWVLILSFGLTVVTAWVKLKFRIDRLDEVQSEIKSSLTYIKTHLTGIGSDIGEIKTGVAVLASKSEGFEKRIDKLEI